MKITFLGADQEVTGSKHLIQTENFNLLLDCGMHQGRRKRANELNRNFPFPADQIDAVILSHAHLDHSGMLPVLVNQGFKGKIYCTQATRDITKFILKDSAMIQEKDAEYYNKHLRAGEDPIEPIYTDKQVESVLNHFDSSSYFRLTNKWTKLSNNIRFKFYDAGHILGSAITLIEIEEGGQTKRLTFTGDLGRNFLPILRSPEYINEPSDSLIIESTYGNRLHEPIINLEDDIKKIINEAVEKKRKIIVPAFSLGRTQELIYMLHKLIDNKEIPSLPIIVDSPLANNITDVFQKYTSDFDEEFWKDFGESGDSAFLFKDLITTSSVEESKAINERSGPFVVIAGSGMCEGGRILHHLKNNISDTNNIIMITGYQAANTLGRKILKGVTPVKIFGREYQVKAKVVVLNELSAHADQNGLLSYIEHIKGLKNVFLVHGEIEEASALKERIEKNNVNLRVNIPEFKSSFEV